MTLESHLLQVDKGSTMIFEIYSLSLSVCLVFDSHISWENRLDFCEEQLVRRDKWYQNIQSGFLGHSGLSAIKCPTFMVFIYRYR